METNQKEPRREQYIDAVVFGALFAIAASITFVLFYRQTFGSPETGYHSDMKAYILEMQGLDSGYSFPYPIFFKLAALLHLVTGPELAIALAAALLNGLAMVVMKLSLNTLVKKQLSEAFGRYGWLSGVMISGVTIALFFVSMLYPPEGIYLPGIKFHYLGVFTPNPYHNATYMAARPFAILAFFWYAKLLGNYEEGYGGRWKASERGVDGRDYVLFSVFLLLATMTKPSFTIVLVGAAGLIMVYRMMKNRFRNFVPTIQLGLCFLPTFLDLLYQYKGVFVPGEGEEGGMGFCFGEVWGLYCENIPIAICLAVGFPLLVLVLNWKEMRSNNVYRFSWQIYAMSFVMAFLLYEKGFRKPDFNFSWGYMYGIFFAFTGAVVVLLQETARKRRPLLLAIQWLAFGAHILCGVLYFQGIFAGGGYY